MVLPLASGAGRWVAVRMGLALTLLACGCAEEGPTRASTDVVYPSRVSEPNWSRNNIVAYVDEGISRVNDDGSYQIDVGRRGIWTVDVTTRETKRIIADGYCPSWSPDGRHLSFSRGGQLYESTASGDSIQLLYSGRTCWFSSWSPDGGAIVFDRDEGSRYSVWILDRGTGEAVDLGEIRGGFCHNPAWSPDGAAILHVRWEDSHHEWTNTELFTMRPDGSMAVRITFDDGEERYPSYSQDGGRIAYTRLPVGAPPQIVVMDNMGEHRRVIVSRDGLQPSWSPDGSTLVFVKYNPAVNSSTNGTLHVVNVRTGLVRPL